jgi:hypothetical protein
MPNNPSMTADQKATATQLRSGGMPYLKIAAKIGVSESAVFKFLTNRQKPPKPPKLMIPQQKPKMKTSLLPPHEFHGSCPIRRRALSLELRNMPQLTHKQLQFELERAWHNTARLSA